MEYPVAAADDEGQMSYLPPVQLTNSDAQVETINIDLHVIGRFKGLESLIKTYSQFWPLANKSSLSASV